MFLSVHSLYGITALVYWTPGDREFICWRSMASGRCWVIFKCWGCGRNTTERTSRAPGQQLRPHGAARLHDFVGHSKQSQLLWGWTSPWCGTRSFIHLWAVYCNRLCLILRNRRDYGKPRCYLDWDWLRLIQAVRIDSFYKAGRLLFWTTLWWLY